MLYPANPAGRQKKGPDVTIRPKSREETPKKGMQERPRAVVAMHNLVMGIGFAKRFFEKIFRFIRLGGNTYVARESRARPEKCRTIAVQ
jgi:hypothetical protein